LLHEVTTANAKQLKDLKLEQAKKMVLKKSPLTFRNRLESLVLTSGISPDTKWADLTKNQLQDLAGTTSYQRRISSQWKAL
jgi:hypothetical protein